MSRHRAQDFFAKKDKKKKKKGKKGFAAVDSSQAAAVLTLRGKPAVRNSTPVASRPVPIRAARAVCKFGPERAIHTRRTALRV